MKGHMGLVDFLVEQPGIDINVDVNNDSGTQYLYILEFCFVFIF